MKVASFVDRSMSIGVALWSMNSSVMLNLSTNWVNRK